MSLVRAYIDENNQPVYVLPANATLLEAAKAGLIGPPSPDEPIGAPLGYIWPDSSVGPSQEWTVKVKTATGFQAASTTQAFLIALNLTRNASWLTSGTIDPARLPLSDTLPLVKQAGGIADLTALEQNEILRGRQVIDSDGNFWAYSGSGSKTDEASYVQLGNVSPAIAQVVGLQAALDAKANAVSLAAVATSGDRADIGLGNVNNTADVDKPVSTAQAAAIAKRAYAVDTIEPGAGVEALRSLTSATPHAYCRETGLSYRWDGTDDRAADGWTILQPGTVGTGEAGRFVAVTPVADTANYTLAQSAVRFAFGRKLLVERDVTVEVGSEGHFGTVQEAADAIAQWETRKGASILINVAAEHIVTDEDVLNTELPAGTKIIGQGWAQETTIEALVSVTGSAGARSVTAQLANATGVTVGQFIRVSDMRAGWYKSPGSLTGKPVAGELHNLFFKVGTLAATGAALLFGTGGTPSTFVPDPAILVTGGQVRLLSNIDDGTRTADISTAFGDNFSGRQYWFIGLPLPGTVSGSEDGTTLTGDGTDFAAMANDGDCICIQDVGVFPISTVDGGTSITLAEPLPAAFAGKRFSIVTPGTAHEGTWEVTAVSGDEVTWLNTDQYSAQQLPVKNVSGGVARTHATVLETSENGVTRAGGFVYMDSLALVLTGSGSVFDMRADVQDLPGCEIEVGASFSAVGGAKWGEFQERSGLVAAAGACFSSCSQLGFRFVRDDSNLAGVTLAGGVGNAVLADGGMARMADILITGFSGDGYRGEVRSGPWQDFGVILRCGGRLNHIVGAAGYHVVGGVFGWGGTGISGQNNVGGGRGSGSMFLAITGSAISLFNGAHEWHQAQILGHSGSIALHAGYMARITIDEFGISGTRDGTGIYADTEARVYGRYPHIANCATAANALNGGRIRLRDLGLAANEVDLAASGGGRIFALQTVGATTSITVNEKQSDGTLIETGDAIAPVPVLDFIYNETSDSLFIGSLSGVNATDTALRNVGVGHGALAALTEGDYNTAMGWNAIQSLQSGTGNFGLGYYSVRALTSGNYNIGIGFASLDVLTAGSNNLAIGANTGGALTSGSDNLLLGYSAGISITSGSRNVVIGASQDVPSPSGSDQVNLFGAITGTRASGAVALACAGSWAATKYLIGATEVLTGQMTARSDLAAATYADSGNPTVQELRDECDRLRGRINDVVGDQRTVKLRAAS